jgi:hypothetical protein
VWIEQSKEKEEARKGRVKERGKTGRQPKSRIKVGGGFVARESSVIRRGKGTE